MPSPNFYEHTNLLRDSLHQLLGKSAVEVMPGRILGSGLLHPRSERGDPYRPRMVVVSGIADLVGRILDEPAEDGTIVVGTTRGDDTVAVMDRFYACCPGTAKDLVMRTDLEDEEIVKLSHSARIAEPETIGTAQAGLYYWEIYERLARL